MFKKKALKQKERDKEISLCETNNLCKNLDRFTNGCNSPIGRISLHYTYLSEEFEYIEYKLTYSKCIVLFNEKYDLIYAAVNKKELMEFLISLRNGAYKM